MFIKYVQFLSCTCYVTTVLPVPVVRSTCSTQTLLYMYPGVVRTSKKYYICSM